MARSIPADIRASLAAPLGRLAGLDPFDILLQGTDANEALLEAQASIASLRRAAVRQLRSEGWTLQAIAEQIGASPQRVHQIETGYDRHERASRKKGP